MAGKLNERPFSVVEGKLGFAEFAFGSADNAITFVPEEPGDVAEALTFLSGFKGEAVKASVVPPMPGMGIEWIETPRGGKYSVIPTDSINHLLKAGYKARLWVNFYGRTPFLNLAFRVDGARSEKGKPERANKFARAPEPAKPARGKFTAKK